MLPAAERRTLLEAQTSLSHSEVQHVSLLKQLFPRFTLKTTHSMGLGLRGHWHERAESDVLGEPGTCCSDGALSL